MRGESPRAVDDHTDGDPDLVSVGHRLNYAVAQADRLCEHAVDTNIGVLGAGRSRCRQRRISDSSQREGEEICIDISGDGHAHDASRRPPISAELLPSEANHHGDHDNQQRDPHEPGSLAQRHPRTDDRAENVAHRHRQTQNSTRHAR